MRIVFSRKGFDSGSGGFPSPIIDGRPISLPIPTQRRSVTTYGDLGLGDIVEHVTRGRLARMSLCHHDPMFEAARCALGQTGAAQAHLERNGVTAGDMFLFFGLFADEEGRDRHHRIFGYLEVESVNALGAEPSASDQRFSDIPKLLDIIGGVRRGSPVAQFASKFRSRREPLPPPVAKQVIAVYERERSNGGFGSVAQSYVDALPCVPPRVDNDREGTYHRLLRNSAAGGFTSATDGSDSAPPRASRRHRFC